MAPERDEIYDEQTQGGDRELAWLAFRYIEGELALAEAAEFEIRLESDQAAREAVAAAVELAAVVELAGAVEIASLGERLPAIEAGSRHRAASAQAGRLDGTYHTRAPRWKLSAGGMALAAAASLLAVLFAYSLAGRNGPVRSASAPLDSTALDSTALDRQLADAWAATAWRDGSLADRDVRVDNDRPLEFDALPEEFAVEIPDEDGPLVATGGSTLSAWESADGELMISDWLWEAVSGAQEASRSETDHRANHGEG
jgi:hypothetical protein